MATPVTELWASPAWRAEAVAWIRAALDAKGITVTGPVDQPRIRIWSTQLTVATDAGRVWFKENNPGQRAEAAVVALLASLAPDHVVPPLAVEAERGWLLTLDQGATVRSHASTTTTVQTWARVVSEYADLQRRTSGHADELFAAGLQSLLPAAVPGYLEQQSHRFAVAPSTSPLRIDDAEAGRLLAAATTYRRIAGELDAGPVPPALEHNDLHHNNAFVPRSGARRVRFFDFGDALWAHPFASLYVTLNVMTGEWGTTVDDPRVQQVIDAYLEVWSDLADRQTLRRQLDLALNLGPVHRLECWRRLLVHTTDEESAEFATTPRVWIGKILERADAPLS